MEFIADFHIHSKYSRATSAQMNIDVLSEWAKLKGIGALGTGDFTHPEWIVELKEKLKPDSNGLFIYDGIRFILSAEVYTLFYREGSAKSVHHVILAPDFDVVDKVNKEFAHFGNLSIDGRPILNNMEPAKLVEIVLGIDPDCLIIPAHAWTPHFSIFGSNSGFDSVEECFGEQTKNIFALETGLSCYDEETEVLTKNGWKKFSSVHYSDEICTLNLETDTIEFQNPTKIFTYKYKGKMYRLNTKRVDLLVTPNHRLLYSPCDFRNSKPYSLREAQLLFNKSKRFKKDGIWIGANQKHFILPAVKIKHGSRYYSGFRKKKEKRLPMKSWLKFFGFWLAEGWTSEDKDGNYNICVSNQDTYLLNEMRQILESFGYKIFQQGNVVRVRDFQLFYYLKQFGKSFNKFVSLNIKSLSKELLEILLKYYLKGDGHIYGRNGKGLSATTSSIRLRDDLQEIALKVGMSAYYRLHQKKGTLITSLAYKGKIYKQNDDTWVTYFLRQNKPIILPSTIKRHGYIESWIDYTGLVFCVAVPNRVIYIRRNGIPLWCGNSDPAMNWRLSTLDKFALISNSDSHSPSRIGREANLFDCPMDYYQIIDAIKKKDKKRFLYTIEFFPQEGKYHYDGHRRCLVCLSPPETRQNNFKCPKCGRAVTVGVMHRVEKLADRKPGFVPNDAIPFKSLIPLEEIIAEAKGVGKGSQTVEREYRSIIQRVGTEFDILLRFPKEKLFESLSERIAEGIIRVRERNVHISAGYDGEYGKIEIFGGKEDKKDKQLTLF